MITRFGARGITNSGSARHRPLRRALSEPPAAASGRLQLLLKQLADLSARHGIKHGTTCLLWRR